MPSCPNGDRQALHLSEGEVDQCRAAHLLDSAAALTEPEKLEQACTLLLGRLDDGANTQLVPSLPSSASPPHPIGAPQYSQFASHMSRCLTSSAASPQALPPCPCPSSLRTCSHGALGSTARHWPFSAQAWELLPPVC